MTIHKLDALNTFCTDGQIKLRKFILYGRKLDFLSCFFGSEDPPLAIHKEFNGSLGCPVLITITCTKIGLIVNGGLFTSLNLGCDFSIHNTTSCFYFAFMTSIKIQCPVHHNHRD